MTFSAIAASLGILGVYHVHRGPRNVLTKARNYIGFAYRIRGCNTFSFGEDDLYAGDGSVVYLPKGVAFRNKSEGPEELVIAHLQPFGDSCKNYEVLPNLHTLEPLFRKLLNTWEAGDYNRSMEVLYSIFNALQQARQPEQATPPVIAPGVQMIRQHFRDPKLTVTQAAKACFISEVYFRRVYRQHFGISPLQELLHLRFDYAAGLLRSGYYSVEQTARMSGFSDVKYFRTAFTRHFGKPPPSIKTTDIVKASTLWYTPFIKTDKRVPYENSHYKRRQRKRSPAASPDPVVPKAGRGHCHRPQI